MSSDDQTPPEPGQHTSEPVAEPVASEKRPGQGVDLAREVISTARHLMDASDEAFVAFGRRLRDLVRVGEGSILGDSARAAATTTSDLKNLVVGSLRPRRTTRRPPGDLKPLLRQLGGIVVSRADDGFVSLADDDEFWSVLIKLARLRVAARNAERDPYSDAPVVSPHADAENADVPVRAADIDVPPGKREPKQDQDESAGDDVASNEGKGEPGRAKVTDTEE